MLWRIVLELAEALHHLHSQRIIHRDIKIVNVFLDENNNIKLGDLGVARALDGEEELAQSRVGTPLYLAPELIRRHAYDYKADVWALGVLAYHMAALKGPFCGDNIYALGYSILNDTPPALPGVYSKPLTRLIMSMLEKAPDRRPSVDEIVSKLPTRMPAGMQDDTASMLTTAAAAATFDTSGHKTAAGGEGSVRPASASAVRAAGGGGSRGGGGGGGGKGAVRPASAALVRRRGQGAEGVCMQVGGRWGIGGLGHYVCLSISLCMYVCMYVYVCIYLSIYLFFNVCMYRSIDRTIYLYKRTKHRLTYIPSHLHIYMHACMHACMHTCINLKHTRTRT